MIKTAKKERRIEKLAGEGFVEFPSSTRVKEVRDGITENDSDSLA